LTETVSHNAASDSEATSGLPFSSKTISAGKSYATAEENRELESSATDTHRQKDTAEQGADKCTKGDMVTLITTVQFIVTGLQTADTEEDSFAVIMRAIYELLMLK
jgi:hypothetical protein